MSIPIESRKNFGKSCCLARGTLISTDTGPKPIEVLRPGDRVTDPRGEGPGAVIINIITGQEHELIALNAKDKDYLFLTRDHPVLTANGLIRAGDLSPGSSLIMEGDVVSPVQDIYVRDYNDVVFNLVLEPSALNPPMSGALMAANGYVVGDFVAQNTFQPARLDGVGGL